MIEDSVIEHFLYGCKAGNISSVRRNLDPAELTSTRDNCGNTGLCLAAAAGHKEIVRFLISVDTSARHLNTINQDGRTALMVAVDGGWVAVVQEILASGNVDREVL